MNIWIVAVGEPLPLPNNKDHLHRVGILSEVLVSRNHNVTWWSSTVDHFRKKFHFESSKNVTISENFSIELLHSYLYKKNISIRRFINHIGIAKKFRDKIKNYEKPDLILSAYPTIELSKQAINYGRKNGIPVLVDVRDLWPEILIEVLPKWLKGMGKLALFRNFKDAEFVFRNVDAILGITDGVVEWGLNYGNRSRTPKDCSFPLGYSIDPIDIKLLTVANSKWDRLGVGKEKFVISYIGAIARNKVDLETVLSEAKRIQVIDPNILFVMCGEGDEKEYYIKMAKSLNNVIFPGWVNKVEIRSLLQRTDLGIAPIRNRFDYQMSIPNKPIEYFSAGKPVLTSLKGELKKLILKHNVGCIYNNHSGNLSETIFSLKNNPQMLNQMAINSYKLFENRFVATKVYNDYADYLEKFLFNYTGENRAFS